MSHASHASGRKFRRQAGAANDDCPRPYEEQTEMTGIIVPLDSRRGLRARDRVDQSGGRQVRPRASASAEKLLAANSRSSCSARRGIAA
jgi:hypothetical protein